MPTSSEHISFKHRYHPLGHRKQESSGKQEVKAVKKENRKGNKEEIRM